MLIYNNKEVISVAKDEEILYPEYITSGLVARYDARGKYNNDTYKQILYDLSGNGKHGTLENFAFTLGSGYTDNGNLDADEIGDLVLVAKSPSKSNYTIQVDDITNLSSGNKIEIYEKGTRICSNLIQNGCGEEKGLGTNFSSAEWTYKSTGYSGQPSFALKGIEGRAKEYIEIDTSKEYAMSFYVKFARPSSSRAEVGFEMFDSGKNLLGTSYIKDSVPLQGWQYQKATIKSFLPGTKYIRLVCRFKEPGLEVARLQAFESKHHMEEVLDGLVYRGFKSLKIYSRALALEEMARNYEIDKRILG